MKLKSLAHRRYDRVRRTQKWGEITRDRWHKADWDAVMKDHTLVQLPNPDYVLKFDCRRYAEDHFERIAEEVKQGRNLNDFADKLHLSKMSEASVHEIPYIYTGPLEN